MRTIKTVIAAQAVPEGAGVVVHRAFPSSPKASGQSPSLDYLDPFLLLDHLGPVHYQPHQAKGFPDHPHRGFETVSYMLAGKAHHKDSSNNEGILGPGDVQWMTAGSGVIHSEMPEKNFRANGGVMEMFQLWVNLPSAQKMMAPRYQDIPSKNIPVYNPDDSIWVKVIAGRCAGISSSIDTVIPILYLHIKLKAGAEFSQPVEQNHTTLAYIISGKAAFGDASNQRTATADQMPIFNNDGDEISVRALEDLSMLLIAGAPLGEPVARWGPFVMNSSDEIRAAIADYQQGRLVQPPAC